MTEGDIAWFAGLFEGEGSMSIAKNGGTRLAIVMTDRDVIYRVNGLFPALRIDVKIPKPVRPEYNQPKTQYQWRISNPATVREILNLLLPWLGERRSARAHEVLEHLDTRPGIGGHFRNKTHCAEGHEYTRANTYIRPGTTYRHCRICRTNWSNAYRTRKRSEP